MKMTEIKKTVTYADVDYSGHLKMTTLFQILTDLATQDAIKLGMWSIDMIKQYGWVVAKQTLTLDEPILLDDEIEIYTIAGKGTFVSFPRYYFIKKNGKEIGRISSIWTLLDLEKRSIVAPRRIGIRIPEPISDKTIEKPHDIDMNIPFTFIGERKVLYSDVDTNQHMNNTRYIEWALDVLDFYIFQSNYIDKLTIHYKKEVQPLKTIQLYYGAKDDCYMIKGEVSNEEVFVIEFHFHNMKKI